MIFSQYIVSTTHILAYHRITSIVILSYCGQSIMIVSYRELLPPLIGWSWKGCDGESRYSPAQVMGLAGDTKRDSAAFHVVFFCFSFPVVGHSYGWLWSSWLSTMSKASFLWSGWISQVMFTIWWCVANSSSWLLFQPSSYILLINH